MSSNRHHVRAYLVGNVSVCGNAIRANYNAIDFSCFQEMSSHAVSDERNWNIFLCELPGSKSCSLQKRARFIGEYAYVFARFNSSAYDPECSPKACCCKSAGIAMCKHRTVVRNKLRPERSHPLVALYILAVNRQRF